MTRFATTIDAAAEIVRAPAENRPMVLATGGGIVTSAETYALLRRATTTVWLRARPEDHWNRVVRQGDRRPMADHPQAMADLRALLAAREPLYAQAALAVDTATLSAERVVTAIVDQVSWCGASRMHDGWAGLIAALGLEDAV